MIVENEKIWIAEQHGITEVNLKNGCTQIRINVGTDFDFIEIDKLYGPTGGEPIRIFLEDYHWVIRRLNNITEQWEEKARWYIQESYLEDEE